MTLEFARRSVHFYIERIRSELDELRLREYPGDFEGPRRWLSILQGLLDTAVNYVIECRLLEGEGQIQEAQAYLYNAGHLAKSTYESLTHLSGAEISELPHPIVTALESWFRELGIANTLIFRADHAANYELQDLNLHRVRLLPRPSDSLEAALAAEEQKVTHTQDDHPEGTGPPLLIYRVTVPSRSLGLLPHYAIVAHEVGHAVWAKWEGGPSYTSPHIEAQIASLKQRVADRLDWQIGELDVESAQGPALERLERNWREEIAADAFGHYLCGPAFFFALSDFLHKVGTLSGLSESHPPHDLRFSILLQELAREESMADVGFEWPEDVAIPDAGRFRWGDGNIPANFCAGSTSFNRIFEHFAWLSLDQDILSPLVQEAVPSDEIFAQLRDEYDDPLRAAILAELPTHIGNIAGDIYSITRDYLNNISDKIIYTPWHYYVDLERNLESLKGMIPPMRFGNRLDNHFCAVLNVGWVALLCHVWDLNVRVNPDRDPDPQKAEILHALLVKAVELAEIQREWR